MWAQLITMRLKPGKEDDLPRVYEGLRGRAAGHRPAPHDRRPRPEGPHQALPLRPVRERREGPRPRGGPGAPAGSRRGARPHGRHLRRTGRVRRSRDPGGRRLLAVPDRAGVNRPDPVAVPLWPGDPEVGGPGANAAAGRGRCGPGVLRRRRTRWCSCHIPAARGTDGPRRLGDDLIDAGQRLGCQRAARHSFDVDPLQR